MAFALNRRLLDKNNCKDIGTVIDAFNDFHDALGNPVNNPGPGTDGTVPPLYEVPWVPVDDPTAGSSLLLIGGLATGSVSAGTGTFTIDTIVSFTPGYTHATSPQTVVNTFGNALSNNQPVFAIYRPDNDTWETWYDTDTGGGGGGTYFAGFGLELATDTFSVDDTGYSGSTGDFELFGSKEGSVQWDTVGGWLEHLDNYTDEDSETIGNEGGTPRWYPMATLATGLINGSCASSTPFVDGDTFQTSGGATPPVTSEPIQNTLGYGIDDNTAIVVMRASTGDIRTELGLEDDPPESSLWHIIAAEQPEVVIFQANGAATDPDADITVDNGSRLWGPSNTVPTTLENPFSLTPEDGDFVWAVRHPGTGSEWYALNATPVRLEVITEITSLGISGGNLVLTYRKQTIGVPTIVSESVEDTVTIAVTECV